MQIISQDEHLSDLGYHLDHSHAEDIGINSLGRCVRTRLYFTSESHLHTLLNVMRFPRWVHLSVRALCVWVYVPLIDVESEQV